MLSQSEVSEYPESLSSLSYSLSWTREALERRCALMYFLQAFAEGSSEPRRSLRSAVSIRNVIFPPLLKSRRQSQIGRLILDLEIFTELLATVLDGVYTRH